ncbi:hypothetical protein L0337_21155 [candidate division KSB1 bacterium]|nr:hypothetical protein [candidate division KSB1 bacterium]
MLLTNLKLWPSFAILVLASPAICAATLQSHEQTPDHLEPNQAPVIRKIDVIAADLFDPDDEFVFADLINALHIRTRRGTIQQEFLFKSSEQRHQSVVDETERNLRALGLFSEVAIRTAPIAPDTVDLVVMTRDKWSTNLNTTYKREGGIQYFGAGVTERNLLGFGKSLDISYNHSTERLARQIQWHDNRFFGSRLAMTLKIQRNTDKRSFSMAVARPFFAWQSNWGFGFFHEKTDGTYREYRDGQRIAEHPLKNRAAQLILNHYWGERVKRRLMLGAIHQMERVDTRTRKLNLAGAGLGLLKRRYFKTKNLDAFDLTEDVAAGVVGEVVGGMNFPEERPKLNQPFFSCRGVWAKADSGKTSLFLSTHLQTFFEASRPQDMLLEHELKIYQPLSEHLLVARVLWRQIKNSSLLQSLSLGDENGLRGFGLRGRTGAKLLLANFESRLRTDIRFWFLRLGFTAFVDLGEAWDEHEAVNLAELKSSLGMGLRLGNAKYAAGINRIDFAYNTHDGTWQISIGTGSYFSAYKILGFLEGFHLGGRP